MDRDPSGRKQRGDILFEGARFFYVSVIASHRSNCLSNQLLYIPEGFSPDLG